MDLKFNRPCNLIDIIINFPTNIVCSIFSLIISSIKIIHAIYKTDKDTCVLYERKHSIKYPNSKKR